MIVMGRYATNTLSGKQFLVPRDNSMIQKKVTSRGSGFKIICSRNLIPGEQEFWMGMMRLNQPEIR